MSRPLLERTLSRITAPDPAPARVAATRLDEKTKPRGSLGRIEALAVKLAGIFGSCDFDTRPRAVVIMAADHGVTAQAVSAYPQQVTAQMVLNFAAGGAAINVLARQMQAETVIVDMGVVGDPCWPSSVYRRAIAPGTADFTVGPAMTREHVEAAIVAGIDIARELAAGGMRVLATGDMGIGNSTAAAALTTVFTRRVPEEVTGRGTGIGDDAFARKLAAIHLALAIHAVDRLRPLDVLACLGGFEIAGLTGLILGAALERLPIVLDGFIAGAAALAAVALAPDSTHFMIAGHRSTEPGHDFALRELGLEPLLDLSLRLGEGTGAVLALPLLDAASRILSEMSTFQSAGVSGAV